MKTPLLAAAILVLAGSGCFDSRDPIDLASPVSDRAAEGRAASGTTEGPVVSMTSNSAGCWISTTVPEFREVFGDGGFRFAWRAAPGSSGEPVTGFSYAIDRSPWSPFSDTTAWPAQGDPAWFPEPGPHKFFVRAIDDAGAITVLEAGLRVFPGPRIWPESERYILVVLDTSPEALIDAQVWPADYESTELSLVEFWLGGFHYQVHQTNGVNAPPTAVLDRASTVLWLHSTDSAAGDPSVLRSYHADPPNPMPSWVESGGNLILCGIQPVNALRYFENIDTGQTQFVSSDPVEFDATLTDVSLADHWVATNGIGTIVSTVGNAEGNESLALRTCRSRIVAGPNPYPDLHAGPSTSRLDARAAARGFGYYDRGILPISLDLAGKMDVIYTANRTEDAIAIRRLTEPGVNGNLIYLGFHPSFVHRREFRQFVRAALADFGEQAANLP